VRVTLTANHEQANMKIVDDGLGFNMDVVESSSTGLGLVSIRERAQLLRGNALIESQIGQGTTVQVIVPIRDSASAGRAKQ